MTSRLELRPMTGSDLAGAARVLARRHQGHRRVHPFLPRRFEDPAACEAELTTAWKAEAASGAVALRGGETVGFLLGAPRSSAMWGPNVWVESAGQAAEDPEVLRDLYGLAAQQWVDDGRTAHYVVIPAHDPGVRRAWCRLGFGEQQAHGVRSAEPSGWVAPAGLMVRRATPADVPTLARLDLELPAHQGRSPVFSAGEVPTLEEAAADWAEDLDDEELVAFVAERDGTVVGSAVGCPVTRSGAHAGLARPDGAALLSFAAVAPAARGTGVGRVLGEAVVGWAAERGFSCVATDWRTTNLLSSRAWPALGFEETFLRLHRVVGY